MENLIIVLLSSSLLVSLVSAIKEIYLWKQNRKATKSDANDKNTEDINKLKNELNNYEEESEDKVEQIFKILERLENKITKMDERITEENTTVIRSSKALLTERIRSITNRILEKGYITYTEKQDLKEMWSIYHFECHANGYFDIVMQQIEKLPLRED